MVNRIECASVDADVFQTESTDQILCAHLAEVLFVRRPFNANLPGFIFCFAFLASILPSDGMESASLGQLILTGVPGKEIDPATATLFRKVQPGGFILFGRNIESAPQLRKLIDDLRESIRKAGVSRGSGSLGVSRPARNSCATKAISNSLDDTAY